MRLASYSPDVTRLRRVAKACAAGELSRSEYRRARREVIENLVHGDAHRDDTVPRFDSEMTVRRSVDAPSVASPNNNRLNVLWLLLLMVVLGALTVPGVANSAGFETDVVPPVSERPVNPDRSPRFDVKQVVWHVPDDWPKMPVSQVQPLLDKALGAAHEVYRVDDDGFTAGELREVARFLNAIGIHDAEVQPSREDISDLKALVERQKSQRQISLHQLEGIAEQLQSWVRQQGYPLAQAFVPAQKVRQGVVELKVLLGVLAEVEVVAPIAISNEIAVNRWQGHFQDLVGQPVQRAAIETRLNLINRVGAETIQASFSPGAAVGETKLAMRIAPADKFTGTAQVDNHGLAALGQERLSYVGRAASLLQTGDRAQVSLSTALGAEDNLRGWVGYTLPWASRQLTLSGRVGVTDLEWQSGVTGDALIAEFEAAQTFSLTRTKRRELLYSVGWQDYEWNAAGYSDQRVWTASAQAQGHQRWDTKRVSLEGKAGITLGGVDEPNLDQDSSFAKLSGDLFGWKALEQYAARAVFRSRFQWSGDQLPAGQKIALSHAHANPGIEPFGQTVDSLMEIGAQLHFAAPLGSWWLFVDSGFGQDNDRADTWYQLTTAGLGWQAELITSTMGRLSSRITLGHPLVHKSNGGLRDDGTQVFWSLRFSH